MAVGRSEWPLYQDQPRSDRECFRSSYRVGRIHDSGLAGSVEESFTRIGLGCPESAGCQKEGERSYAALDQPDPQRPARLETLMSSG